MPSFQGHSPRVGIVNKAQARIAEQANQIAQGQTVDRVYAMGDQIIIRFESGGELCFTSDGGFLEVD